MIKVIDNTINVHFDKFDSEAYKTFIQSKNLPEYNLSYDHLTDSYTLKTPTRFAHIFGMEAIDIDHGWLPIADYLFDYEQFIVKTALEAKRYAVWADTGLGKTAMGLEFARQVTHRTGGRFLIIAPLNIISQTIEEAEKFYGTEMEFEILESRSALKRWAVKGKCQIAITNPAKFIPRKGDQETISELHRLVGCWLDESSILKTGGGTIKWALIKSCRGIEYKLSTTATPAPNDTMEYASQGSFLEKLRSEGEILWTFFCRDKFGNWKVKEHAKDAFYRFMSGWSIYLKNPKNYGFADNLKDLPKPIIKEYVVETTSKQREIVRSVPDPAGQLSFFGKGDDAKLTITDRSKYSQLAKGFRYEGPNRKPVRYPSRKPEVVLGFVKRDVADGLQVLIWTVFDEESEILSEMLNGQGCGHGCGLSVDILTGKLPKKKRLPIIDDFRHGKTDVLISKASLLGYGLNFQSCGSMVYSGFDDSFERFYQSMRRAYRYGQTKAVRVHIPYIPELEGVVWKNIMKKQETFERDTAIMERNYLEAMKGALNNT